MNGTSVIGDVLNKAAPTVKAFPPTNCKFQLEESQLSAVTPSAWPSA